MKTLFLVRHAKSSWDSGVSSDFDRPLNDRGKHDAPMMAKRMLDRKMKIDQFVSSPAKRARKTAEAFAEEYGVKEKHIVYEPSLYHASVSTFYQVIENLDNKCDRVAIFSHNPGITDFVNTLTDNFVDNMPTCAVFGVQADIASWSEFRDAKKEFILFDFPKKTS
jgi:phosphohistidine phosphatase